MTWDERRAEHYDRLGWVESSHDLLALLECCDPQLNDVVLDVGTGTGVVAKAISPLVKRVLAIDPSPSMLKIARENCYEKNIELKQCDAQSVNGEKHDCIIARMTMHHVDEDFFTTLLLQESLKEGGRLVVMEGTPPEGCREWYRKMFALKERRHVYTADDLVMLMEGSKLSIKRVAFIESENMSLNNWLENSATPEGVASAIREMHTKAPPYVKKAYNMRLDGEDILMTWRSVIVVGVK